MPNPIIDFIQAGVFLTFCVIAWMFFNRKEKKKCPKCTSKMRCSTISPVGHYGYSCDCGYLCISRVNSVLKKEIIEVEINDGVVVGSQLKDYPVGMTKEEFDKNWQQSIDDFERGWRKQ